MHLLSMLIIKNSIIIYVYIKFICIVLFINRKNNNNKKILIWIRFDTHENATSAIVALNGTMIKGRPAKVFRNDIYLL